LLVEEVVSLVDQADEDIRHHFRRARLYIRLIYVLYAL
jgi:hypothetical protein